MHITTTPRSKKNYFSSLKSSLSSAAYSKAAKSVSTQTIATLPLPVSESPESCTGARYLKSLHQLSSTDQVLTTVKLTFSLIILVILQQGQDPRSLQSSLDTTCMQNAMVFDNYLNFPDNNNPFPFNFKTIREHQVNNNILRMYHACQHCKEPGRIHGEAPARLEEADPWSEVTDDLIGPWTVQVGQHQTLIVIALISINMATTLSEIMRIKDKMSEHIAQKIELSWLARYPLTTSSNS